MSGRTGAAGLAAALRPVLVALTLLVPAAAVSEPRPDDAARGRYLVAAGGCLTCHTDRAANGPPFAGGARLATPFGDFYPPNITPHPRHGIGAWSEADFARAMRDGVAPDGAHYFPAFPYTSYTLVRDVDLAAMYAFLMSLPPVDRRNRPHEIRFPFGWRFLQTFWKLLFFEPGPFGSDPDRSAEWNRGAYLVRALAHCGECHTPRNALGAVMGERRLAGAADGPEGEAVPNITPHDETGIGAWSAEDLATYLSIGMDPDGDFAGSLMADVIAHGTGALAAADLAAIAVYLRSLPPIENRVGSPE